MLVLEAGGARRLAAEALDELFVLGEAPVQHLERDLAPELEVLGAVDLGHPARAEPVVDAIARVDDRAGVEALAHRSSDSMTDLATGAAKSPPKPGTFFIITAIATRG